MFSEKRLQAIENKELGLKKERQESSRARKLLKSERLEVLLCEKLASEGGNGEASLAEVRQGKELAGLDGTSCDIIPFG